MKIHLPQKEQGVFYCGMEKIKQLFLINRKWRGISIRR